MRGHAEKSGNLAYVKVYGPCACCGYSESRSCLVSARATRRYATCCMGTKLKFSEVTRKHPSRILLSRYKINVGKVRYHRDTLPSGEESDFRTGRSGMHRRAAPPPQPAALSHCATLARRSRSVSTTWTATRAAQSWVKMVSIGLRAILMILSIHLNGAVLVSVHALSLSLLCLPLVLSTVHNFCAWGCFCSPCSINIIAHSDCSVLTRAQAAQRTISCSTESRPGSSEYSLPCNKPVHLLYVRSSSNARRPSKPRECALTSLGSSSRHGWRCCCSDGAVSALLKWVPASRCIVLAHVLGSAAGGIARCARMSVGGGASTWNSISPHPLLMLSSRV